MSETKRERAKKILSQIKELCNRLGLDNDDEFEQAFSDMDKMDKVEKIFDRTYYNICNSCSDSALIDCKCCEFNMIKQIIKE